VKRNHPSGRARLANIPCLLVWLFSAALSCQTGLAQAKPELAVNQSAAEPASPEDQAAAVEARDPERPKVISVAPPNGSQGVATNGELRLRFDQPMDPMSFKLNWKSGGFLDCGDATYDTNRFEFTIPIRLAPGALQRIVVNEPLMGVTMLSQSRQQFPIEGFHSADGRQAALFVWNFRTQPAPPATQSSPPRVISIAPPSGSTATLLTFVEIQFDQPMMPPAEAFPWLSQTNVMRTAELIANVRYNASNHTFRLPLLLPPRNPIGFQVGRHHFELPRQLTPNGWISFTLNGFLSAAGVPAAPIPLEYRVEEVEMAAGEREQIRRAGADKRLLDLLAAMQQRRSQLLSIAERVQVLESQRDGALLKSLDSKLASFQMQLPDRFLGDVSQNMLSCRIFRIGSDGRDWWFHSESGNNRDLSVCPVNLMQVRELSFCDPFGLASNSCAKAAADLGLIYVGTTNLAGRVYHLVEAWHAEAVGGDDTWGSLRQWWIDVRTLRPMQLLSFSGDSLFRTRFFYDAINQPLDPGLFAVPQIESVTPSPPETLDANYTERLVIIRDGADGHMSQRWGKRGPKGMSSGGLN